MRPIILLTSVNTGDPKSHNKSASIGPVFVGTRPTAGSAAPD